MDRVEWLDERQRAIEQSFDADYAPTYDEDDSPISATHARFVTALIERCPPGGRVLDAACGTGKYFAMVLDAGRRIVGIDQSAGMLAQASAKFPTVEVRKVALLESGFDSEFDAAMCVDAMENVPPERWPAVLRTLHGAVRPGGHVYLTVELTDEDAIEAAFVDATRRGLPAVMGEDLRRGGGYHYYPGLDQVRAWLDEAGLDIVEEAHSPGDHPSYSYQHFLTRQRLPIRSSP
jgi:ubiquinone/menaquinone biosynthesis C-methylase UbiE